MYTNYKNIIEHRESVNNNIGKYNLLGNSFREMLIIKRRYRAI